MNHRGILYTISGSQATYDLYNLEPVNGDGIKKLEAKEVEDYFLKNKLEIKTGSISIWGDTKGRKLPLQHTIVHINFNEQKNILTLTFENECFVKIKNPQLIYASTAYLKIIKATEILWQITDRAGKK